MSVILVIDEHRVYRSGIRELIEARVARSKVIEASRLDDFNRQEIIDLLLIDAGCLTTSSLLCLKEMHEIFPTTRFAIMSSSNTRADVLNSLSAGFHGFVHKLQSDQELIIAVNDLLSGRIYVPKWLADGDDAEVEIPAWLNEELEALKLTRRQGEILPLIAQGMSNKEIALHLNIAEGTTKIHTAALLRALGARNRTEAAFMAAKLVGNKKRGHSQFRDQRFVIKEFAVSGEGLRSIRRWG